MLWLYNAHCLPWTLHYTWVCLKLTSPKNPASNDSSLSCGSALSGETVCWPQGHTRVTCLHPWRGRTKINSTNNPKKMAFQWKQGFSESDEEGWGMYLVRCVTWRCRSDVSTSVGRIQIICFSKNSNICYFTKYKYRNISKKKVLKVLKVKMDFICVILLDFYYWWYILRL